MHLPASRAGDWVARVIDQAVVESNERRPGGDAVLERLSEMMFIDVVRRYLDRLPEDATGWLAGLRDRVIGKALALLHERPDYAWSVDDLAREVGLSRSALHERFVNFLGLPPTQYLAHWRIQLGARLLRESHCKVAAIALDVGYDSEAAFRRLVGRRPRGGKPKPVCSRWLICWCCKFSGDGKAKLDPRLSELRLKAIPPHHQAPSRYPPVGMPARSHSGPNMCLPAPSGTPFGSAHLAGGLVP